MVLVDFTARPGSVRQVALSPADVAARSARAVEQAMDTVRGMADRVRHTVESMAERPESVEVEFGITFDVESGALIAKARAEAALTVRVAWGRGGATAS
jgi:hypothetical protein